jgi:hypothetical protein
MPLPAAASDFGAGFGGGIEAVAALAAATFGHHAVAATQGGVGGGLHGIRRPKQQQQEDKMAPSGVCTSLIPEVVEYSNRLPDYGDGEDDGADVIYVAGDCENISDDDEDGCDDDYTVMIKTLVLPVVRQKCDGVDGKATPTRTWC